MAATKAQGRWPEMTATEEADRRDEFAGWSRRIVEEADPGDWAAYLSATTVRNISCAGSPKM